MAAFMILALGAFVVSIVAGLSGAAPISRLASEAKRSREPVMPKLPPEVIAVLSRNALLDGPGSPSDKCARGLVQPKSAPLPLILVTFCRFADAAF